LWTFESAARSRGSTSNRRVRGCCSSPRDDRHRRVVVAVGVRPRADWLLPSGAAARTDAHGRTRLPGVWAAGDCAEWPDRCSEGARGAGTGTPPPGAGVSWATRSPAEPRKSRSSRSSGPTSTASSCKWSAGPSLPTRRT
jgi:hypothetical protein